MFNPGDVVLGPFATQDGNVVMHYSVVLETQGAETALAYITSLKDDVTNKHPENRFSAADMRSGGLTKPCMWHAQQISVTPTRSLVRKGRVSDETFRRIVAALERCSRDHTVEVRRVTQNLKEMRNAV